MAKKDIEVQKIFIGSPGDIKEEREIFRKVVEKVNKIKAEQMGKRLEAVGWEDTLPGAGRPQGKINKDIKESDLVILLLWKRWGQTTGKYSSGFEEEFHVAEAHGKEIILYFRSLPDDMLADPGEQLEKVLEFRDKIEKGKKYLYSGYEDEKDWEDKFLVHLCGWLDGLPPNTSHSGLPPDIDLDSLLRDSQKLKELEPELAKLKSERAVDAIGMAEQAQELADSGHITKAEGFFARALAISEQPTIINDYGLFLRRIGSLQKAEEKFIQLRKIGELLNDKLLVAISYGNLGVLFRIKGDRKSAEGMYKKALAICEELGFKEGMATAYGNLGVLHGIQDDLETAEDMFRKALAINEELGLKEGMASNYGNLGILYNKQSNFEAAEEIYDISLTIHQEIGDKEGIASAYGNLGSTYLNQGDLEAAEDMYKKSLGINEELGRKEGVARNYYNLGLLYSKKGDIDKVREMYKKALELYESVGMKPDVDRTKTALAALKDLKKKKKAKGKRKKK